jgi:hypothetical protein
MSTNHRYRPLADSKDRQLSHCERLAGRADVVAV